MEEILKKGRERFYKLMEVQNYEWLLIDSGVIEEDEFKQVRKIKPKKDYIKPKQYI